jgi:excisionase family DNA binding protein
VAARGQKEVGLTHRRTTPCPPILPNLFSRRPSQHHRRHLDPAEPLLSVVDTAAALQVSTKTIRRLLARGELGASRVGRQLRISRAELLAYLRRQLLEA